MTENESENIDIAPPVKKIDIEGKTMNDFSFFTRRKLENKEGETMGRATVAVPKGTTIAQVEYECPLCGEEGYVETEFVRAKSKTFKFRCEHCTKVVRLPKLSKPPK